MAARAFFHAVHNLRASLDHIVLALARKGAEAAGVVMTRKAERAVQFPVSVSVEQFEDQVGRHRLRYVEPEAKTIIERLQPYWLRSADPEKTWLAMVDDLDITDKHRTIPSTGAVISYTAFSQPVGVDRPQILHPKLQGEWGLNTEIVRYRFSKPHPEVNMEFNPSFTVAIDGGWPPNDRADTVLASCAQAIRDWILDPLATLL